MKSYIGEVNLIKPPKEITEQSIADYIAQCAGVVRDKEPKNSMKLLHRLMEEAYGGKPSRVLEYIPCKTSRSVANDKLTYDMSNKLFGFCNGGNYYTNARELLSWDWSFESILSFVDFEHYRTVHCVAPYFIYGQLSTHTQITSVSHSQRFAETDRGYWCPKEVKEYVCKKYGCEETDQQYNEKWIQDFWGKMVLDSSPRYLRWYMKNDIGIKRREIWARGSDMLQYRPFTLGGYTNDPHQWQWFIKQRTKDNHVQKETRDFVSMIAKTIGEVR